ncbi:hypothetical protein BDV25DRAFT_153420 [Aspergillus avenaceus]|uniref:Uncharacterized protein n=1 Tax=Aspergillus avenaceus TaxID=36643 RepID=A0A5N6TXB9_ASPAV|nr:hypothetical protein BDV25DRAFT_153420 [Aspergillus avenaceus]
MVPGQKATKARHNRRSRRLWTRGTTQAPQCNSPAPFSPLPVVSWLFSTLLSSVVSTLPILAQNLSDSSAGRFVRLLICPFTSKTTDLVRVSHNSNSPHQILLLTS